MQKTTTVAQFSPCILFFCEDSSAYQVIFNVYLNPVHPSSSLSFLHNIIFFIEMKECDLIHLCWLRMHVPIAATIAIIKKINSYCRWPPVIISLRDVDWLILLMCIMCREYKDFLNKMFWLDFSAKKLENFYNVLFSTQAAYLWTH